jgi:uncharacterized protein (DUF58 family)
MGAYAELRDLVRLRAKATGFSFLPRQPVHSVLSGKHASRLRGRGLNFEEIRRYLPGDDIRSIDWKVTARTQKPHIRVYTDERDRPVWYIVDQRLSMFFGSGKNMKSVTAAEVAALGAWRSLSVGDRAGGVVFNDEDVVTIKPHRSEARVLGLLNEVLRMNRALRADSTIPPDPGKLNEAIELTLRVVGHDALIVLISDGSGADEHTASLVTRLAAHNDVISVLVHDPLEAELPDAGELVMSEGGRQLAADTGDSSLRRKFSAAFAERLEGMKSLSRTRKVPLLPVTTTEGVAEQVRRMLGVRPGTGGV